MVDKPGANVYVFHTNGDPQHRPPDYDPDQGINEVGWGDQDRVANLSGRVFFRSTYCGEVGYEF